MDWNSLKFIDAIAATGSLTSAAKRLQVDTSTLSRHLQRLEREHSVRIFKRRGNTYQITPAGQEWVLCAGRVRAQIDAFQGERWESERRITVTTLEIFLNHFLLPRLGRFSGQLAFIGADRALDLSRREADVAIRFGKPTSGNLVMQKLFTAGHAVYCGKAFRTQVGKDLRENRWVTLNDTFSDIDDVRWFYENIGERAVAHSVSSCQQILTLLQHGPFLGILPCYMGDSCANLVRVQPGTLIFERTGWLLLHQEMVHAKHIRAFVTFLKDLIRHDQALLRGI